MKRLTDASFERALNEADRPVLVDFWAEWCGPCRMMAPVLEQIADARAERLTVAKIHTEENPRTVDRYDVSGLPTLILFEDGKPKARLTGFKAKPQLLAEIDELLAQ